MKLLLLVVLAFPLGCLALVTLLALLGVLALAGALRGVGAIRASMGNGARFGRRRPSGPRPNSPDY